MLISTADEVIKVDRRAKRGKKQASAEITPSYQTRDRELGQGTKETTYQKANTIHRIFTDKGRSPQLKNLLI